jgi:prepilin-type N-terminal cleavage/methylation domain-containing protein
VSLRQRLKMRAQAGDTLIEVMLAIVVLSMVLTGAYQATTGGLRIGQNAIERTSASQTTSAQAEALRTLRDQHTSNATSSALWTSAVGKVTSVTPSTTPCTGGGTPTTGSNPFWVNLGASSSTVNGGTQTQGYLKYWVEAYQPNGVTNYVDFYIRGCWQGIGATAGVQNTGIVLRLVTG